MTHDFNTNIIVNSKHQNLIVVEAFGFGDFKDFNTNIIVHPKHQNLIVVEAFGFNKSINTDIVKTY